MKVGEYSGKKVRITMDYGQVFEGIAYDYTSALDNEPDPESISIGVFELDAPESKKIEVID